LAQPHVFVFGDFDPLTVRARPGGFAALDRVTQQLVLLDSSLAITARVSRRGAGPGELDGVLRLVPWAGGLAVGEGRNRRISLFSHEGRFRGIAGTPYSGTPFAIRDDKWIATASTRAESLLELSRLDAPIRQPIGQRPLVDAPDEARHVGQDHLVFRADGTVLMLENRTGSLFEFKDDGSMTAQWTLPESLVAALRSRRRERVRAVEAATGARVYAAPLFKDIAHVGGSVVVLQPMPPHCVFLISLFSETITPLDGGSSHVNDALCRAESLALTSQDLVLAVNDSILRFPSPLSTALAHR